MHQLGVAKRSIESFQLMVTKKPNKHSKSGRRQFAFSVISTIAQAYGHSLSRQSDRYFPRVRFSSSILTPTKKEGKDYIGIILCLVIALLSKEGKHTLNQDAHIQSVQISRLIKNFELILFFDEFLKNCDITKEELNNIQPLINHFIKGYSRAFPRDGMGQNLIKNHLYFHLQKYMLMFGPPSGWDSAPCEGHHKTDIKAPSKNTQQNASTLIRQTCQRKLENASIDRLIDISQRQNVSPFTNNNAETSFVGGSKYKIFYDHDGKPTMEWSSTVNQRKPHLPQSVLRYCCKMFLDASIVGDYLQGFTEHNRKCNGAAIELCKFRANPSYRCDSGLSSAVWYDWAQFLYKEKTDSEPDIAPAQLLCFLDLTKQQTMKVKHLSSDGTLYVVVRSFKEPPKPVPPSKIVTQGTVYDKFLTYPCNSIVGPVAVVPNRTIPVSHNKFFVVANRKYWLESFKHLLRSYATDNNSEEIIESENEMEEVIDLNDHTSVEDNSDVDGDSESNDDESDSDDVYYGYYSGNDDELLDSDTSSKESFL